MQGATTGQFLETVYSREQQTLGLDFMPAAFPKFAEEVDLGRSLKQLLATGQYYVVRLAPHRQSEGNYSPRVSGVYAYPT